MDYKFTNNAASTLVSAIDADDATVLVQAGHGTRFPDLSIGGYFMLTIEDRANNKLEIVMVVERVGDTLTVVRAQEGSTAQSFAINTSLSHRLTAGTLTEFHEAISDFAIRYLGAFASAPDQDNNGNPVQIGALYFNTTVEVMSVYTSTGWIPINDAGGGGAGLPIGGGANEVIYNDGADNYFWDPVIDSTARTDAANALSAATAALPKAGGTMTGPIVLNADPTLALHAAPKQFVVAKAGDVMTGPLTLYADPGVALHAATKQYVDAVSVGGRQVFTGSGDFTVPASITKVKVTLVGGGAGGGSLGAGSSLGGASGGGAGGGAQELVAVTPAAVIPVTIGGGGGAAAAGGTTSFGAFLQATGGSPGATHSGETATNGGVGGVGSGGDVNISGERGDNGWTHSDAAIGGQRQGGEGGSAPFGLGLGGRGGQGGGGAANGFGATGSGGGGGGAHRGGGSSGATGGVGTGGIAIVEW